MIKLLPTSTHLSSPNAINTHESRPLRNTKWFSHFLLSLLFFPSSVCQLASCGGSQSSYEGLIKKCTFPEEVTVNIILTFYQVTKCDAEQKHLTIWQGPLVIGWFPPHCDNYLTYRCQLDPCLMPNALREWEWHLSFEVQIIIFPFTSYVNFFFLIWAPSGCFICFECLLLSDKSFPALGTSLLLTNLL